MGEWGQVSNSETISVTLGAALVDRLEAVAGEAGRTLDDCLLEAVREYVEGREDFARSVAALEEGEDRGFLRVISG